MAKLKSRINKAPSGNQPRNRPGLKGGKSGAYSPSFPIVGLGASAGGLQAFRAFFQALPADTGMAFVLIQHMDPEYESQLSEILERETSLSVTQAAQGISVRPNCVYVIPPGTTIAMEAGELRLSPRPRRPAPQHRPIDHFLESLAFDQGCCAIGVVLSGTGNDGTMGVQEVKNAGGITFAQDGTALHDGMPRSAEASGAVDFVLSPDEIARELSRIAGHPYLAPDVAQALPEDDASLPLLLKLLRNSKGVDFNDYKRATLMRRITRRMVLHRIERFDHYISLVENDPKEAEGLYQDILIGVTGFFRNPQSFDFLKESVFPALTGQHSRLEPLRVWVVGCSTGEEAYSLAIALAEYGENTGKHVPAQIFASDVNATSIVKARAGIYTRNIMQDVSPQRLQRFFDEVNGKYRVSKRIRETCIFAQHNILAAPPFSRLDLISCRNVLIYLKGEVQRTIVPMLNYALNPGGLLWLGNSETIGTYRHLFALQSSKHKLYRKAARAGPVPRGRAPGFQIQAPGAQLPPRRPLPAPGAEPQKEADRILLARYAPASILVTPNLEILQYRGETGQYISPSPGRATLDLLKMLREGLLTGVRSAVYKARREGKVARAEGMLVKSESGQALVNVEVVPLSGADPSQRNLLILFENASASAAKAALGAHVKPKKAATKQAASAEAARLRQELDATREYLESIIEQQDAGNEELQAANEEVQSSNEELQSINEELETSKEEIQSTNEELTTVNEELQHRNSELAQMNDDFLNLINGVQIPILMLGPDLSIRRLTPNAERLLKLGPADVGRPISDVALNMSVDNLGELVADAIRTGDGSETEVTDQAGRWRLLRVQPYRTIADKIEGALVLFIDIDAAMRSRAELRTRAELLDQAFQPIIAWELDGSITHWNRGAVGTYGHSREQAVGHDPFALLQTSVDRAAIRDALLRTGRWSGEFRQSTRDGKQIAVESTMVLLTGADQRRLVVEANHSVTERIAREQLLEQRAAQLAEADRAKNEFLAMLAHELRNPLAPLSNAVQILQHSAGAPASPEVYDLLARQTRHMSQLVNDLLDAVRITQGKINLRRQRIALAAIIEFSIEDCRDQTARRSQRIEVSLPQEPVYVEADPMLLEQVFTNLLQNASKYSNEGATVSIAAAVEKAERNLGGKSTRTRDIVVRITDNGVGIDSEELERIFDLFTQVDRSLARTRGGLGVGLALAHKLVAMHGGTISARSEGLGKGSEFIVRLPFEPALQTEAAEACAAKFDQAPPSARRILIVDDSVDGAQTLAILLKLDGHEVHVAHDARSALAAASKVHPDVALLDIGLPGMDGYELSREMRKLAETKTAQLIALSGYEPRNAEGSTEFDHYMVKPVDLTRLRELLRTLPAES